MRILHIGGYTVERGGTSKAAFDLMTYQLGQGHQVDLITVDFPNERSYPLPNGAGLIKVKYSPFNKIMPDFSMGIFHYLKNNDHKYDILQVHGIWNWGSIVPFMVTKHAKIVISLHGALSKWALQQSELKKKVFGLLFQRRFLRQADALIALTEAEKEDILNYVHPLPVNVAVIPNGIEPIEMPSDQDRDRLKEKLQLSGDFTNILFLSRIHKVKGMDLLIKALDLLSRKYPKLRLLIAGPDEGYKSTAEKMISERGLESKVVFLGSVVGREKETLYTMADVFVLPSYSEGLPMTVLEAMALRVPVAVSDKTRIDTFIKRYDAGKVFSLDENEMASVIGEILDHPEQTKQQTANATDMVLKEFGADAVNQKVLALYSQLIS